MSKVSIVTINYNSFKALKKTICSLQLQKRDLFEFIIIDGKSNDINHYDYQKLIKFADIFVSEPDEGISDAWNKGIKLCSCNWILLLNSGDILEKDILEETDLLLKNSNLIYTFSSKIVNEEYNFIKLNNPNISKMPFGMYLPHNFTFIPISFYKKYGLYRNIKLSMDYEWFLRNFNKLKGSISSHPHLIIGSYPLGGRSDKNAISGFITNFKLQLKFLPKHYFISILINLFTLILKQLIFNLVRFKYEK